MKEEILKIGVQTISKEIDALISLKESLGIDFVDVVELLMKNKGRLVICGIGKSAIVGKKIVATLNSTGTAAIFMHAADAAHGDLGMLQENDILLCISKSGETEELIFILQMVKQFGNIVIAMTSDRKSKLGKASDYILYTPIEEEADPNNLAPTSSSTVQMAMGDALAISLSSMNGFTAKHFAKFHPGGALGKQLYLKVDDIINHDLSPAVFESDNLKKVIVEMTSKRLGATIVMNNQNDITGIITDGDLRRMLNEYENTENLNAEDIMSEKPMFIETDILAIDALKLMRDKNITQLIVVDQDKYIGLVHIHDILSQGL